MKLLILTQKVDKEDPTLGFFHNWILEFTKNVDKVSVICLEKGDYDLPQNVKVYSLGKESGRSKIKYVKNFFNLILGLNREYDAVFVHMNQEYVLLGGFIWKILGKKIYFWRNHLEGGLFTRISVWLSNKVFCTSKTSFTAKFKKTILMPVGIDTDKFVKLESLKVNKLKNSILFLGRMDKIKKPDLLIEALDILNKKNINFVCDFYGDPTLKTGDYFDLIKKKVLGSDLKNKINFYKAVANYETPKIYSEHSIYVNLTPAGSFDKTILEAAACGCLLVVANKSLLGEIDDRMITGESAEDIAERIEFWFDISEAERKKVLDGLKKYVTKNHSVAVLIEKIEEIIK